MDAAFFARKVLRGLSWRYRALSETLRGRAAMADIAWRWATRREAARHGLPGRLVVSLTSYPPRFGTLALTLKGLLTQSVRPDRIVLWLAHGDEATLPGDVLGLLANGLEIRRTADIRSFKKIIPALKEEPDAFIVTADDDVHYGRHWLQRLIEAWDPATNPIVCHRAHQIELGPDGRPLAYDRWGLLVPRPAQSDLLFPTGVGGVLYPPGSFDPLVLDQELFMRLCPRADDIWLYVMGRRSGKTYRTLGMAQPEINWPGTQHVALYLQNYLGSENDQQLEAVLETLGWPAAGRPGAGLS